ncbi:MAG: hypothetical protein LBF69_06165 [Prevotellaceae bacterium]|nr:hypothetical protein [Prevotellaceae bacterium]
MKRNLFMMSLAAVAIAFAGCEKNSDETSGASPEILVNPENISATAEANIYGIAINSNTTWLATVNTETAAWCALTDAGAIGNGVVTVHVANNTTLDTRVAAITVTATAGTLSKQVAVTQSAGALTLEVHPTTIDAGGSIAAYPIGVACNGTWTATVNSAATSWCTLVNTNATGNGTVTVNVTENQGTTNRATTVTVTSGALQKTIAIQQVPATPPGAVTTKTWVFGSQLWSDAIHISGCNKPDFVDSNTNPDCRSYTEGANTWYYYNFPYVKANAGNLCPSPWRVPTQEDFNTLVSHTDWSGLSNAWGSSGGYVWSGGPMLTGFAHYGSSTEYSAENAYELYYFVFTLEVQNSRKFRGRRIRCVRN